MKQESLNTGESQHSRDREAEAAAKAAHGYANAFMGVGCSWDDATEVMRQTWRENSQRALAAADEVDPVRKAARELAHFIEEDMGVTDDCYDDPTRSPVATVSWQDITRLGELRDALAAALGAAGVGEQGGQQ